MLKCFQDCKDYIEKKYEKHKNHVSLHYILSISLFVICIGIFIYIKANKTTKDKDDLDFINEIIKELNKQLLFNFYVTKYYYEEYENK